MKLVTIVPIVFCLLQLADATPSRKDKRGKSVIQLISDGYGPASATMARSYMQARDRTSWDTELALDRYEVGSIRTRSVDAFITDSGASATAYSCGLKSKNAYVGVDIDKKACGTVLEAAKAKGYNTGLVSTSRITHATPACYASHVSDRGLENEIASQELGGTPLGRTVDILWGGGLRHFLPNTTSGGVRVDGRDLTKEARDAGWHLMLNKTQFDAAGKRVKLPSLGLFARSHMAYEMDRDARMEPSLTEMAIKALDGLKAAGKPFFIMIEGARIDHAGHSNDPAAHVHDIIEYQKMFYAVTKWVEKNDRSKGEPDIVVLSTSDHECGGLTLVDLWHPEVVANATRSTEFLSADFAKATANGTDAEKRTYMAEKIIKAGLGVNDIQENELERALELAKQKDSGYSLMIWLSSIVNWRARIMWSTTGHSGVDVPLFVYTKRPSRKIIRAFRGNRENTHIGQWIAEFLHLDLDRISYKLNNNTDLHVGSGSENKTFATAQYHGGEERILPPLPAAAVKERRRSDIGYSHADNVRLFGDRGFADLMAHESNGPSIQRSAEL